MVDTGCDLKKLLSNQSSIIVFCAFLKLYFNSVFLITFVIDIVVVVVKLFVVIVIFIVVIIVVVIVDIIIIIIIASISPLIQMSKGGTMLGGTICMQA